MLSSTVTLQYVCMIKSHARLSSVTRKTKLTSLRLLMFLQILLGRTWHRKILYKKFCLVIHHLSPSFHGGSLEKKKKKSPKHKRELLPQLEFSISLSVVVLLHAKHIEVYLIRGLSSSIQIKD